MFSDAMTLMWCHSTASYNSTKPMTMKKCSIYSHLVFIIISTCLTLPPLPIYFSLDTDDIIIKQLPWLVSSCLSHHQRKDIQRSIFVSDRFHLPGFQSPPDGHLSWSNLLEAEAIYLPLQWLRISVTRIAVPAWTRVRKYISNGYEMATSFPKFTHISTAQHKTNSNSIA